jgi:hypothetical protein
VWTASAHLKDTIAWTVLVALAMVFKVADESKEDKFFQNAVKDAIKITIVLEFVVGLYPFSLLVELFLVPLITVLVVLQVVAETKDEYQGAKRVITGVLMIIGVLLLWHSIASLLSDTEFVIIKRIVEMLMPSILTVLFLPFIYILALYAAYNAVFVRLAIWNRDSAILRYAKRQILLHFGLNRRKLIQWSKNNPMPKVRSKYDVLELIGKSS